MLLRYLGAGALALALLLPGSASAAGYPLVTGKCGCAIGWGLHIADCGSIRVTCTKAMCARACEAKLPKKTSNLQVTDVSSVRRMRRGGDHPVRHAGVRGEQRRGYASRDRGGVRPAARVDIAGASQTDRDGRGYATASAGVSAPIREVTHRRGRGLAVAAIQGAAAGGTVAVEHSRPADCYGIQWCGCFLRHAFGLADRSLNLAIRWASIGSPATVDSANVVVWRHHVGRLIAHENGRILVQSGNDGGAVRTRWLSPHILGGVVAYRKV